VNDVTTESVNNVITECISNLLVCQKKSYQKLGAITKICLLPSKLSKILLIAGESVARAEVLSTKKKNSFLTPSSTHPLLTEMSYEFISQSYN
jgi:hypothetical protein